MSAGCEHPNATGQRMFIRDGIHLRLCAKCHVIVTKDYADVITARDRTIAELTAERDRLREAAEDMRRWAQGLVEQMPEDHEGAASWLMNYGDGEVHEERRRWWKMQNPHSSATFARAALDETKP